MIVTPERVKQARVEAHLSQVELAAAVGCSPRAVQYWETPGVRMPRAKFIRALAEATGKPVGWFFALDGEAA